MITSQQNPLAKRIRKLQRKKYRQREGAFYVEGIRVVLAALEQGAPVETIVYAPELLTSDVALEALSEHERRGIRVATVSSDVFASFSARDNPYGLGAIVELRLQSLWDLPVGREDVFVAVDSVSDPGNLGTIVRTLDSVGAAGLILAGQGTDPFHPTAVKASMGALFSLPVAEEEEMDVLWRWCREHHLYTIATSAGARESFWDAGYAFPALVIMGSEGEGLAGDVLAQADVTVTIPMQGTSSSLNLAVATGVVLYELRRRLK